MYLLSRVISLCNIEFFCLFVVVFFFQYFIHCTNQKLDPHNIVRKQKQLNNDNTRIKKQLLDGIEKQSMMREEKRILMHTSAISQIKRILSTKYVSQERHGTKSVRT